MIVVLALVASPFLGQIGSVVCTIMSVALHAHYFLFIFAELALYALASPKNPSV